MEKTEVQNQVHLDSAVHLLGGNLSEEADRSGLDNHQMVVDLQELKAHFGSGSYDVDIIAPLLARMGTHTTQAASFAEGNTAPRVTKLGEALTAAAHQLRHGGPVADTAE